MVPFKEEKKKERNKKTQTQKTYSNFLDVKYIQGVKRQNN